jgi:geranylgeranyl diphosphate synthase type I
MEELNAYFLKNLPIIEADLESFIALTVPNPYTDLRSMIRYHMGWEGEGSGKAAQGKRIRPMISLLTGENFGMPTEAMIPFSTAIELLHNFSLIHDDIEDHDELRRGRETVWRIWGIPQAINTGDLMFSLATQSIVRPNKYVSEQQLLLAVQSFQETCTHLTMGQHMDMKFETQAIVSPEKYMQMISGKTAALLGFCFAIGPIAAARSQQEINLYRKLGETVGLAFQIQDDYLGIWGDIQTTGKAKRSDLISRKKSLPILCGLEKQGKFYDAWISDGPITDEMANRFTMMLEAEGVRDFIGGEVKRFTDKAANMVEQISSPEGQSAIVLKQFIQQLMTRDH